MFAAAFGQQRLAHKLAQNGIYPPTSPPPKHFRAVKFNREMFLSPNDLHVFWKQFLVNVSETLGFYLQRRRASLLGNPCGRLNNGVAVGQCLRRACVQSRTHRRFWLIGENINTHTHWSMTFLWAQAVWSLTPMGRIVKSLHQCVQNLHKAPIWHMDFSLFITHVPSGGIKVISAWTWGCQKYRHIDSFCSIPHV